MSAKPLMIVEDTAKTSTSIFNAQHYNNIVTSIRDFFKWIVDNFLRVLELLPKLFGRDTFDFGRNVMPFLTVVIVIFVILMVIFKEDISLDKNVTAPKGKNFFNPLSFIPIPTYKMKLFSYNFAPYGNTPSKTISDRPKMKGRCDNLRNYEKTASGVCLNTTDPEPIVWTLDVENMPELGELSQSIKQKVDGGEEAGKYTVTIPWSTYKSDGLHFYPDCKKATFGNGKSASYLFTDNDTRSCEKISVERTLHTSKLRPKYMSDKYISTDSYLSKK